MKMRSSSPQVFPIASGCFSGHPGGSVRVACDASFSLAAPSQASAVSDGVSSFPRLPFPGSSVHDFLCGFLR